MTFSLGILPLFAAGHDTCLPVSFNEPSMIPHTTTGPFEVKLVPQNLSAEAENSGLGRMSIEKIFHGALEGTSSGEMISFRSSIAGSAGYVAMETFRGSLNGHLGSFVLQHSSTLSRGDPVQSITVVPDSGTDELTGLEGRMTIEIGAGGEHAYHFEYVLPAAAR